MGSLTLPKASSGSIYLDTDALIYSVERVPQYWPLLEPLWSALQSRLTVIAGSELLVIESLTGAIESGDPALRANFESVFASGQLQLFPVTRDVLVRGAELRAAHRLRTPDAIHAATALLGNAAMFLTNDVGYRRVPGLPVVLLDDVLRTP